MLKHIVMTRHLMTYLGNGSVRAREVYRFKLRRKARRAFYLGQLDSGPNLPVSVEIAAEWAELQAWKRSQELSQSGR